MGSIGDLEKEAIILNAVWDMIDGMVNFRIFMKLNGTVDTNVMFNDSSDRQVFNILLTDFLSQPKKHKGAVPFDLPTSPTIIAVSGALAFIAWLIRLAQRR